MIVSFVLNTEYMSIKERDKWFLKNVSFARHEDVLIVTHEYIKEHLDSIVANCADRFFEEFEMERVAADDIRKMNIVYVPDVLVQTVSRSQEIISLTNNRNKKFEDIVIPAIENELAKRGETAPELIFNCLHVFESVRYVSEYFACPLVPYVFSAIRKVHGYTQTLYMAHCADALFNCGSAKQLHQSFQPDTLGFPVLNNRELLALLGKQHNLCLLPMLKAKGQFELAVIGEGFHITPQIYQADYVTDDDVYFEAKKHYSTAHIKSRLHPLQMDQAGVGRKHMKNDPAAFLLSCKRATTVQSQMIIKAALWNRGICVLSDALPYAFLFQKDFQNINPINAASLNFILFGYFVPDKLMFNKDYWVWRATNPSANEVLLKHLKCVFADLEIDETVLYAANRLEKLLYARGCTQRFITKSLVDAEDSEHINYPFLSSKASLYFEGKKCSDIFCLNDFSENEIVSTFEVESIHADCVKVSLTNDVDGFVTIHGILVNGKEIEVDHSNKYCQKNTYNVEIAMQQNVKDVIIKICWCVKGFEENF